MYRCDVVGDLSDVEESGGVIESKIKTNVVSSRRPSGL